MVFAAVAKVRPFAKTVQPLYFRLARRGSPRKIPSSRRPAIRPICSRPLVTAANEKTRARGEEGAFHKFYGPIDLYDCLQRAFCW